MKNVALVAGGVVLGYLIARVLREPSGCAKFVADATRDKVRVSLGETAASVGDLIGWDWSPGVVAALPRSWTI